MSRYLPEIHDVHPGALAATDDLLALLNPSARRCAARLVVPCWSPEDRIDVRPDDPFIRTLRDQDGRLVLHGLTHAAPATWWSRLHQGPRNSSEFVHASLPDARAWIEAGTAAIASITGRRPTWFCAPRWEQNDATTAALRATGFDGWMMRDRLVLASGGERPLPTVWFDDGERPWVRAAARPGRTRRIARVFATRRPFRLALHPRDLSAPGVEREIRSILARLDAEGWTPMTLDEAAGPPPGGGAGSVTR